MTYWGYHLIFTLPLILILLVILRRQLRPAHFICWGIVSLIAFCFTTPWDNYAVYLGIWGFGDGVSLWYPLTSLAKSPENPDGLTWLGHIPIEEYAFFIIEGALVCLVLCFLLFRSLPKASAGNAATGQSKPDNTPSVNPPGS